MRTLKYCGLVALLALLLCASATSAQDFEKYPPQRLTHHMSPEEQQSRHLIGINFVETDPPPGNIISLGEFERSVGVLVRYPFGIPVSLIREMARDAKVTTLVTGLTQENTVRGIYSNAGVNLNNCSFIYAPSDSYWTRDYGPWYIAFGDNQIGIVDFPYNRPRPNDDNVPVVVANSLGLPLFGMNVIHTGGNYMTDSYGTAASTTIAYTENPSLTPAQVDQRMQNYLGINNYHVVEDPNNTYIDHIDCWGKYLATNKILIRSVPTTHPQYNAIEATAAYFASLTTPWGVPYEVYRVNTPQNQPYTNSFILNDKVFVPIMNSQYDEAALQVYRDAMPGYKIFGVIANPSTPWESTDALHCRTHEMADPGMLRIRHTPLLGNVNPASSYSFAANIASYSGSEIIADSAILYYRVNPNPYTPYQALPLSATMGSNWSATIPAPEYGSTIQYYLHAADASGRSENHPFIGKPDPHEFYIGEQLFAQAQTNQSSLSVTLMKDLAETLPLQLENIGELSLNYFVSVSTDVTDTLTKPLSNSPATTAYDYNTFTENGWTSLQVAEAGTMSELIVSYNWTTDNYPTEGSFWAETPSGLQIMLASGQSNGNYNISNKDFEGQALQGNWKFWIEDSYGDGGHQAKNISVKFIRATSTGNWLSVTPAEGSVAINAQENLQVTADATGIEPGNYSGKITILSNDPDQPEIEIPVLMTVTINTAVERPNNSLCNLVLYPVPAGNELFIKPGCNSGKINLVQITDMSGRSIIFAEGVNIEHRNGEILLDISGLKPGMYLLSIRGESFNETYRFIRN